MQIEILTAQLAKVEELYETLARKHSVLVAEHQDLIRRAFPTPLPLDDRRISLWRKLLRIFTPRVVDNTILP